MRIYFTLKIDHGIPRINVLSKIKKRISSFNPKSIIFAAVKNQCIAQACYGNEFQISIRMKRNTFLPMVCLVMVLLATTRLAISKKYKDRVVIVEPFPDSKHHKKNDKDTKYECKVS